MAGKITHKIKVQRQGAISMTIPMMIVRALGISVGDDLKVEYDQDNGTMIVQKWSDEPEKI